jgi:hypothetical protein
LLYFVEVVGVFVRFRDITYNNQVGIFREQKLVL